MRVFTLRYHSRLLFGTVFVNEDMKTNDYQFAETLAGTIFAEAGESGVS
jgi:hypothetical protein